VTVRLSVLAVGALVAARDRLFDQLRREEGQAFVEYALVLLVVAIVIGTLAVWSPLGTAIGTAITKITTAIGNA
jgi:Flp pilus assembly pilin Flp